MNLTFQPANTLKIILLGDSHLAGLKLAISAEDDREFFFAAYPSHLLVNMGMFSIAGETLVPTHSDLKESLKKTTGSIQINLCGADAVVLTGLRSEFPYKLLEEPSLSNQVLCQSMMDLLKGQSLLFALAKKIRKINQTIPIIVIPNPLITEHLKSTTIRTAPGIVPYTDFGKLGIFSNAPLLSWQSALETTFAEFGAHLCHQHKNTITDGIYTRAQFAGNPMQISPNIRHMNIDFWKHVLNELDLKLVRVLGMV